MECISIKELQQKGLPSSMPSSTEIGVWKRSTGYEVILPYRLGWLNWFLLGCVLVGLVGSIFLAVRAFPELTPTLQAVLYTGLVVPVLGYMLFLSFKLSQTRTTKIRIDMTPMNMTFTFVEPSGVAKKFGEIPVNQIDDVCIDMRRGILVNGNISGTRFGLWTGRGLYSEDLHYLACVIGQVSLLSAQDLNPNSSTRRDHDDVAHIELG